MGTEREIDALASSAINESEKEFFAEAMGHEVSNHEGDGDRALESMGGGLEGRHEDEEDGEHEQDGDKPEAEASDGKPAGEGKERERGADGKFAAQGDDRQPGRQETPAERGLRAELTGEREKRREAEGRATELETRFKAMEQQLQALTRPAPQQPQPPKQEERKEQDQAPDRWTDPEGYDRWLESRILSRVEAGNEKQNQQRVGWSFQEARAKHGEAFDAAYREMNAIPADHPQAKAALDFVMRSPDPGAALMELHRRTVASREIGGDPVAYREKVASDVRTSLMNDPEFRKQVLAAIQTEARGGNGAAPRTETQLPPSLSSARGGPVSRHSSGTSDGELFAEVMAR